MLDDRRACQLQQRFFAERPKVESWGQEYYSATLETSTALLRCSAYNHAVAGLPFVQAYDIRQDSRDWPEEAWREVASIPTTEVWELAARSIGATMEFVKPLPPPEDLLFGDRRRLWSRIRPRLSREQACCRDVPLSAAGKHIQERVRDLGGLPAMPRAHAGGVVRKGGATEVFSSVFNEIRRLTAPERARIYEEDFFDTGMVGRLTARNTAWALFQAGHAQRACFYLLLSGLFPIAWPPELARLGIHIVQFDLWCRCAAQMKATGGRGQMLEEGDPRREALFGRNAMGHSRLQQHHAEIARQLERDGPGPIVRRGFRLHVKATVDEAGFLPNERLQADLLDRAEQLGKDLAASLLREGDAAQALQILESSRSNILRLYDKDENRQTRALRVTDRSGSELRPAPPILSPGTAAAALDEVARCLEPSTLALVFSDASGPAGVFRFSSTSLDFVRLPALENGLAGPQVERLLRRLGHRQTALGLHGPIRRQLRKLYDLLLRDALTETEGIEDLLIVPAGPLLFQLPFGALHDGKRYLMERFGISVLPSLSRYLALATLPELPIRRCGFLRGDQAELAGLDREEAALRDAFEGSLTVWEDSSSLLESAPEGLCFLAGHGSFDVERPLQAAVELGGRGRIRALDLYRARLAGLQGLVLNLCDSGKLAVDHGQEVFGLLRACLSSDCRATISTLLPVDDEVASRITERLCQEVARGRSIADGLRLALLGLLRRGRWSHPWYWCAYQYHGPFPRRTGTGSQVTAVPRCAKRFEQGQERLQVGIRRFQARVPGWGLSELQEAQRHFEALGTYQPGLELTRAKASTGYFLGTALMNLGRYSEACEQLVEARDRWDTLLHGPERIPSTRSYVMLLLCLAGCLRALQQPAEAIRQVDHGLWASRGDLDVYGSETTLLQAQLLSERAQCLLNLGRYDSAQEAMVEARTLLSERLRSESSSELNMALANVRQSLVVIRTARKRR